MSISNTRSIYHSINSYIDVFYLKDCYLTFSYNQIQLTTMPDNVHYRHQNLTTQVLLPLEITDWFFIRFGVAYLVVEDRTESYNILDNSSLCALKYRLREMSLPLNDNIDQFLSLDPNYIVTNPTSKDVMFPIGGYRFNFPKSSFYIYSDFIALYKTVDGQKYIPLDYGTGYEIQLSNNIYLKNEPKLKSDMRWTLIDTTNQIANELTDKQNIVDALQSAIKLKLELFEPDCECLSVK